MRWQSVSSPKQHEIGHEEMSLSYTRGGVGWVLKTLICSEGCELLEKATQRSRVTIPECI